MKSDQNMKNRKNAIFHYTCCKTRSQKEVQKQKRKKKNWKLRVKKAIFRLTCCKT